MDNLKCCQSLNFNCYVGLQIEKQMNSTADKVHALFLISLNLNLMKRFEVHKPQGISLNDSILKFMCTVLELKPKLDCIQFLKWKNKENTTLEIDLQQH